MAICQNCGNEVNEGEVCSCQQNSAPAKQLSKETLTIIAAAAAGFLFFVIILAVIFGGGYKKPVNDVIKAINKEDGELYVKAAYTEKMLDYYDDSWGRDEDDLAESFEDEVEDVKDNLEDDLGKKIKYSVKFREKEKLDKDDIEDIEDACRDNGYRIKIQSAYELECDIFVKGKDDKDDNDVDITVIKVEGEGWKLYSGTYGILYAVS
ncbi:MAG: hypothetical protein J6K17_11975 [Oscillospiraceae bacterium]|nr:hypothetical protein [Oscillospiraceae bacterium]